MGAKSQFLHNGALRAFIMRFIRYSCKGSEFVCLLLLASARVFYNFFYFLILSKTECFKLVCFKLVTIIIYTQTDRLEIIK